MSKTDNSLISVVVPIYNVEKYLRRCVDSIIVQSYSNLEIILVDDGSPDNSGVICDDYAVADSRITVCHKDNGGLSDARNCGVDVATGEYITFIDADDYVAPNYIEFLHRLLITTEADIACCDYLETYDSGAVYSQSDEKVIYTGSEACIQIIERNIALIVSWGKLFPLWLVKRHPFPKGKIHEDEFTTYRFFFDSNRVAFGRAKLYAYFQNEKGIMKTARNTKQNDIYEAYIQRSEFFEKEGEEALADVSWRWYRYKLIYDNKNHRNWSIEHYKQLLKRKFFHPCFTIQEKAYDICYIYFPGVRQLGKKIYHTLHRE